MHKFILILFLANLAMAAEINDPLKNGSTGNVRGGRFSDNGWTTLSKTDAIEWQIPTAPNGKISFDVTGLYGSNTIFPNLDENGDEDMHYTLFNMYDQDPDDEWYGKVINGIKLWHNPYKAIMHVFGYVVGDQYKWQHGRFRLNVAAFNGGYDDDPHAFEIEYGPVDWQKDHTFHMELVWGEGKMEYFVDGQKMVSCDYSSFGEEYAPPHHALRLGSSLGCKGFGHQVPLDVTFSNFVFERYKDETAPHVVRCTPRDQKAKLDEYIAVIYDEAVKEFTPSIQPDVAGEFKQIGNTIVFDAEELMQPQTRYMVSLSNCKDAAGNVADPFEFTFETHQPFTTTVPLYGVFEYVDTNPLGTHMFEGPTQTKQITGFDDGDWWKIRMAPTEVGTWKTEINGKEISFECTPSNLYHVKRSEDNPYTFEKTNGEPWAWKGETSWRAFTHLLPLESRYKEYIDLRKSQGYTCVQSIVVSYINGDAFWANEGGTAFELFSDGKNYDKWNSDYYRWIDRRIEYANSQDMVPVILFTWAQEFVKFSDEQFKNFIEYLAARWSAYNIIWVLSGEYNEVYSENGLSPEVWKQHGHTLYNADPYKHLISLHPSGRGSSREFHAEPWFGFIMQQWPINYAQHIAEDRQYNLPVVNAEYAYADWHENDDVGRGAWQIFIKGGFYTAGFFHTFAPDKGGWDLEANAREQQAVQVLNEFMDTIPWWTMQPEGDRLTNGQEFLIYNEKGEELPLPNGDVIRFNPKTGKKAEPSTEHVIYISPVDNTPPMVVENISINE